MFGGGGLFCLFFVCVFVSENKIKWMKVCTSGKMTSEQKLFSKNDLNPCLPEQP